MSNLMEEPPVKFAALATISRQRRYNVLEFIKASAVEVLARRAFREEPTHGNLTAWTDAKNLLDDRMKKL